MNNPDTFNPLEGGAIQERVDRGDRTQRLARTIGRGRGGVRGVLALMALLGVGVGISEVRAEGEGNPPTAVVVVPGAPERTLLRDNLEAVRPKLVALLQGRYPQLFSAEAMARPETNAAIDGILTNLTPARIALLTERGANFVPSPSESAMIIAEVQKANGWAEVGALDSVEVALIESLPHITAKGQTFATIFGANHSVARALSRQYAIRQHNTETWRGIIIYDGVRERLAGHAEFLAPFLPKEYLKDYETVFDYNADTAAKRIAIAALDAKAKSREEAMEHVRQLIEALRSEGAKKILGLMNFSETIATVMQIWTAVQEGFKSSPPDFSVAQNVRTLLTSEPLRDPAKIMRNNQRNFDAILRASKPDNIGQLLVAYFNPKGPEAGEVFSEAAAKAAGLSDDDIKGFAFFRSEMKPAIAQYLRIQFRLFKIVSIQKATDSGRIILTGDRGSAKYELEFYTNASNQWVVQIFRVHPGADTQGVRQAVAEGGEILALDFAKIQEVIVGKSTLEAEAAAVAEAQASIKAQAEAAAATQAKADAEVAKEKARYQYGIYQGPEADAGWVLLKGKARNGFVGGYAKARRKDGATYAGHYVSGKRQGKGIATYSDGAQYIGEWQEDKRTGKGTYTWPNGEKYVGQWRDDKRNGKGTNFYANGMVFSGEFKDDRRMDEIGEKDETGVWSFSHPKYKKPGMMYVYAGQLEAENNVAGAKVIYNHIIKTFPDSPAALRATDRLRQIQEAGAAAKSRAAEAAAGQRASEDAAAAVRGNCRAVCETGFRRCIEDARRSGKGNPVAEFLFKADTTGCRTEFQECSDNCR